MLLRSFTLALLAAATAAATAQSNTFDLQIGMKSVGRSTYTLAKAKQGFKLSSHSTYHILGIDYDSANEFKFTDAYAYIEGGSNGLNQMYTSYTPNKAHTDLVVGMVQAGVQDSHHLAIKPDFALLLPFDAGTAQVMLLLATTHPTVNNLYNVIVPSGGGGSGQGGANKPGTMPDPSTDTPGGHQAMGNNAYDALWTKGPDTTGTLDGKPVTVHSYLLTSGKSVWTFYADDANTLMQLDNSMVKASYIRAKFKLDLPQ